MDWGKVFGGLVGAAAVAGGAYLAYKGVQWTIEQVDDFVGRLEGSSDQEAIQTITATVPQLDEDSWGLFASRLNHRSQSSSRAASLLQYSMCVRNALGEVQQLLSYGIQEAFEILVSVLPTKSDEEQLALVGTLATVAQSDMKARAIIGKLQQAIEG